MRSVATMQSVKLADEKAKLLSAAEASEFLVRFFQKSGRFFRARVFYLFKYFFFYLLDPSQTSTKSELARLLKGHFGSFKRTFWEF